MADNSVKTSTNCRPLWAMIDMLSQENQQNPSGLGRRIPWLGVCWTSNNSWVLRRWSPRGVRFYVLITNLHLSCSSRKDELVGTSHSNSSSQNFGGRQSRADLWESVGFIWLHWVLYGIWILQEPASKPGKISCHHQSHTFRGCG